MSIDMKSDKTTVGSTVSRDRTTGTLSNITSDIMILSSDNVVSKCATVISVAGLAMTEAVSCDSSLPA